MNACMRLELKPDAGQNLQYRSEHISGTVNKSKKRDDPDTFGTFGSRRLADVSDEESGLLTIYVHIYVGQNKMTYIL
jgi:hypothetical protein